MTLIPATRTVLQLIEKVIMDYYIGEDGEGDMLWKQDAILSTELKKMAGFGKVG